MCLSAPAAHVVISLCTALSVLSIYTAGVLLHAAPYCFELQAALTEMELEDSAAREAAAVAAAADAAEQVRCTSAADVRITLQLIES